MSGSSCGLDALGQSAQPGRGEEEKLLGVCRVAWEAVTKPPAGLKAEATFTHTQDGKTLAEGSVVFAARGEQYRAQISLRNAPPEYPDQITVLREPGLVLFSMSQRVPGNVGRLTDAHLVGEVSPAIPPVQTNLPISPIRPFQTVNLQNAKAAQLHGAKTLENGDIELKYKNGQANLRLICSKNSGYNITLSEVHQQGYDSPVGTTEVVKWKQTNQVWHPQEVVRTEKLFRGGKQAHVVSKHVVFTSYNPQAGIAAEDLTLDGVGLPAGARIHDKREAGPKIVYRYQKGAAPGKTLGDAVEGLPIDPPQPPAAAGASWVLVANVVGVSLLSFGAIALWRHRRQSRAAG
jgi:hypothetical protein